MPATPTPQRFVSVAEFRERSSLSTSTVYRLMADGALLRPQKLSPGRVGWDAAYIDAWMAERADGLQRRPA